jgi:hypothetical protein
MRQSPLRRAVGAWAVISAAALLFGSGVVGNTFASFSAETTNSASAFADGWLGAATNGTLVPSGYNMTVNWTPTTTGPIGGQKMYGVDNGTNSNCTGASYALLATLASATTSTYSDTTHGSSTTNGHWYCYEVMSTSTTATNWTTPYNLPAVQLGLVATSANITGNNSGSINNGDTIKLTFNQAPASPGSVRVCTFATGVVLIGDTHSGGCSATTDTYTIAKLQTSSSISTATRTYTAASSVSGNTLTLTIGTGTAANVSTSASWSLALQTTGQTIVSAATTRQAALCTTAGPCTPAFSVVTAF